MMNNLMLGLGLTTGKGGGVPWTPAVLGGALALWSSAVDTAYVDVVGDNISDLVGKSSTPTVSQADADKQPLLLQGGARFDGVNDLLATASAFPVTGTVARHVFAVFARRSSYTGPVVHWGNQTNGQAFGLTVNVSGSGLTGYVWGGTDLSFGTVTAAKQLAYFGNDGAGISYGSQNGALTPSSGAQTANTASAVLNIAARPTDTIAYVGLDFYEMVIVTGTLTISVRQQIEGYLAWNNGLQTSLPSGHPYKNARP